MTGAARTFVRSIILRQILTGIGGYMAIADRRKKQKRAAAGDPQAKEHLWAALNSLASAPVAERTLTGLAVLLQSQQLKQALAPYCVGGPRPKVEDD